MDRDEQRKAAEEFFSKLSPEERRGRIFLKAAYRDAYNEILDNEDRMTLPRYFWRKWLPILGAEAAALFVVLRDTSQTDAKTGDGWCWPDQAELGRMVGLSEKPVRKYLALLESHGFIAKERTRVQVGESWQWRQGTNKYTIWQDIPLTPADAVELLLRRMAEEGSPSDGRNSRLSESPAENAPSDGKISRLPGGQISRLSDEESQGLSPADGQNSRTNVSVSNILTNVYNVGDSSLRKPKAPKSSLSQSPVVQMMGPEERSRREALAVEVGESLARMAGDRSGRDHKSAGFHRRVAFLMPETLVLEALRATRDAYDEHKVGGERVGAYFGGIVKLKARESGIDLGLGTTAQARPSGSSRPNVRPQVERPWSHGPMGGTQSGSAPSQASTQATADDDVPCPPEEAKKYLAEIIANLSANKRGTA